MSATTPEVEPAVSRGYANYVLATLTLVYVFNFIDRQVLAILLEPIKRDLGVSDTAMGFLTGFAFAFFYTVAGIPIARWADRGTRRSIIAIGLSVWSVMTVASGLSRTFVQLATARVFVGIGEAAGSPPAHSLISDYFPPERRATALAIYGNGIYVGAGLAFILGGYINQHFDWHTVFLMVGLPGLPLALLVRFTIREPRRGQTDAVAEVAEQAPFREVLRFIASRRSFVHLVIAVSFQSLSGYAILGWAPTFLGRVHQLPYTDIGLWLGLILMFGGSGGAFLGGYLADRLALRDKRWYMFLSAIVSIASVPFGFGFLLLPDPIDAIVSFIPFYILAAMYLGPMFSVVQGLVKNRMRATASAIMLFIVNLIGAGAGPLVVGFLNDRLADRYGDVAIRYSLVVMMTMGAISSIFFYLASRSLREDLTHRDA